MWWPSTASPREAHATRGLPILLVKFWQSDCQNPGWEYFACNSGCFDVFSPHMKKDIHPKEYRQVIFSDSTSGKNFLIGSTIKTTKTAKWEDGKEYPVFNVEISSASHPLYTGQSKTIDTAGRVEKWVGCAGNLYIKNRVFLAIL